MSLTGATLHMKSDVRREREPKSDVRREREPKSDVRRERELESDVRPNREATSDRRRARASRSDGNALHRKAEEALRARLVEHTRMLRGVCYRMTGSAADADDLVQETFVRAMERPPASLDEPLAPWLLRVAVNLGRDALRKRRRRSYAGTWLPSPIEVDEVASFEIEGEGGTEGRYDLIESVSFAFLVALEALTPNQRAVVLMRDVLDRSVLETSAALGISEANVKVLHHRARRALATYEASRGTTKPSAEVSKSTLEALQRFMSAMGSGDEDALASVFAKGAESWADGGGVHLATRVVVQGAERVVRLFKGLAKKGAPVERLAIRSLNGVPMLVVEHAERARHAPRSVLSVEVDASGHITRIYTVLAPKKLTHVAPIAG